MEATQEGSCFCYVVSTEASCRGSHSFVVNRLPIDTFELVPSEDLEGAESAFVASGTFDAFGVEEDGFDAADAREEAV